MRQVAERIVYSPTDVVHFLASPFSTWMDRRRLEDPDAATPEEEDAVLAILADMGQEHEDAVSAQLSAEGREVSVIRDDARRVEATRQALTRGDDVIAQAALEADGFAGVADFLVRSEDDAGEIAYEVWDAKLARSPRPAHLVQLCAYADMLEAITGRRPKTLAVALGTGELLRFRTEDFIYFYARLKAAFLERMRTFDPETPPLPASGVDHGRWASHADAVLEERDHLSRVANIRRSQIRKLERADISTLTELADTTASRVPKLDDHVFERLRAQARIQRASAGEERPRYEVIRPRSEDPGRGLALLPPPSPLDVFFDMEGDPLAQGGLEYLFGATHVLEGRPAFRDFWAFDEEGERRAFEDFVDWVMERRRNDPSMHVYHYAPYETTALKRLMGKYATREEEVDHLLRTHAFVDLYRIVSQGLRVGEPSYSLKNVERLYMDREGEVATAMESVVYFERWKDSGEPSDWRRSDILRAIRDYNREDCDSTWRLAKWLRKRQGEEGIAYLPPGGGDEVTEEKPLEGVALERRKLFERLLEGVADLEPEDEVRRIQTMLGHLIEFHRREEKPLWWSFFERHGMTPDQLVDDPTCIGRARRMGEPVRVKQSLAFSYEFDPDQDTKIHAGNTVYVAGNLEAGLKVDDLEEGRIFVKGGVKVLARLDGGEPPPEASFLLHEHVGPEPIPSSIQATAEAWRASRDLPGCLRNFFLRTPPALDGHEGGALLDADEDVIAGTTRVVRALRGGTLTIQGPPGTGKTYVGSHVIASLLRDGKNVGVVSNSHEAVLNLMGAVNLRYDGDLTCLKAGGTHDHPFFASCRGARHAGGGAAGAAAYRGGLVGGTAWFFSHEDMAGRLDYLFVDEAGQVSVANLVGMARSTENVVLLGDQMQLAQPVQGTHPGESGSSALDYVMRDHATVPRELGIFLARTWRLHPAICGFISGAVYEDRLEPEPLTANRVVRLPAAGGIRVPVEAGIVFSEVEHEGNGQASDEEVERILEIVAELDGRVLTDADGRPAGGVGIEDILFIAPYNMQVRRLRESLPDGARVASVDKFQGQEAPIVIVSLCTSPGEAGPRGLGFVLDRNRLNVAISRARSLAIVVGDPRLALAPVSSIEDLERQNLLCRLLDAGGA